MSSEKERKLGKEDRALVGLAVPELQELGPRPARGRVVRSEKPESLVRGLQDDALLAGISCAWHISAKARQLVLRLSQLRPLHTSNWATFSCSQ